MHLILRVSLSFRHEQISLSMDGSKITEHLFDWWGQTLAYDLLNLCLKVIYGSIRVQAWQTDLVLLFLILHPEWAHGKVDNHKAWDIKSLHMTKYRTFNRNSFLILLEQHIERFPMLCSFSIFHRKFKMLQSRLLSHYPNMGLPKVDSQVSCLYELYTFYGSKTQQRELIA